VSFAVDGGLYRPKWLKEWKEKPHTYVDESGEQNDVVQPLGSALVAVAGEVEAELEWKSEGGHRLTLVPYAYPGTLCAPLRPGR